MGKLSHQCVLGLAQVSTPAVERDHISVTPTYMLKYLEDVEIIEELSILRGELTGAWQ